VAKFGASIGLQAGEWCTAACGHPPRKVQCLQPAAEAVLNRHLFTGLTAGASTEGRCGSTEGRVLPPKAGASISWPMFSLKAGASAR
jgi:hypothetical protein